MGAISDVLFDVQTFLGERGIDWYVFGAQAVVVYGRPRQTADVDVTIDVSFDAISELAADLEKSGFTLLVEDIETFAQRTRVIPLVHTSSEMPVDMILAGPGLEQEFIKRAIVFDVGTIQVPFISPEDLLAIKILAGRPKDLDDVRGILEKQESSLDNARVLDILRQFEAALDRSDLVSTFETISTSPT